jgi:tetratricopeptide (TPR) repeat protein
MSQPQQPDRLQAAVERAAQWHRGGDLGQAETIYTAVLDAQPRHFAALHMLGVLRGQQGRHDEAVACMHAALTVDPRAAAAWSNLGLVLALANRHDEALSAFERVLVLRPGHVEAMSQRGRSLLSLGRAAEALAGFDAALAREPDHVDAIYGRANALMLLDRPADALADYDRVLARAPGRVDALYHGGAALLALDRFDEALAWFERLLAVNPTHADALDGRGAALDQLGRSEEAVAAFDKALALQPDSGSAWSNRGQALMNLQRPEAALACFDRALAVRPGLPVALHNRAIVLAEMSRIGEAISSYEAAIAVRPDYAEARFGRSLCLLLQGDYRDGWRAFESRWETSQLRGARRTFAQPLWLGDEDVRGKTVLLHAEQGLGDTVQFCRFARLVAARGADVVLDVQPELRALVRSLGPSIAVMTSAEEPAFDLHCPLMSLPLALGVTLGSLAGEARYLAAPAEKIEAWRARLGPPTRPRIGLVWAGNPRKQVLHLSRIDRQRSVAFDQLAPLLAQGYAFYSLQKGDGATAELGASPHRARVIDLTPAISDFADTAALIENLDLVITVDTAVAHVAGALGKPVWLMNRFNTCWRWSTDRDDSPWYPTMHIFRQPAPGDWQTVIARIAAALREIAATGAPAREPSRPDRRAAAEGRAALRD